MYGCMGVYECMSVWVYGRVYGRVYECMSVCVWAYGRVGACVDWV